MRTRLTDISAVGMELSEDQLLGISGGMYAADDRSGCYIDNMCKYDDISL
ncbi:hypothetical protein GCM10010517_79890 [Streptosporangium fragile]|uniref:Natural product n=1 Tax=Streptosporangium fragile TaxID=46186 RepID=A0ABP6IXM2_9ACTN